MNPELFLDKFNKVLLNAYELELAAIFIVITSNFRDKRLTSFAYQLINDNKFSKCLETI